jgi:hypothetical protein
MRGETGMITKEKITAGKITDMATDITKDPRVSSIVNRVKNILLTPQTEWDKIEGESTTIQKLFTGYVLILAVIPAVFTFLYLVLFAPSVAIGTVTIGLSIGTKIGITLLSYVQSLLLVAVLGLISENLAPQFGGKQDRLQAFKLAAYSLTASWVAGVLSLLSPILAMVVGLYSYYLFYLGCQKLLKVSKDKAIVFTAIVAVVALIVMGVVMAIAR